MRVLWTKKDIKALGVYAPCAKCGCVFTRYHRKKANEDHNKKDLANYEKAKKTHEINAKNGIKSTAPKLNQKSLQIACCMFQDGAKFYGGITCGKCDNGTCELCTNDCSFVCSMGNYQAVLEDRLDRESVILPSPGEQNNARAYLNKALQLKQTSTNCAKNAYAELIDEGKLSRRYDSSHLDCAISHQASLSASNFVLHNPPGHRSRLQLKNQMEALSHAKGPSFISHHGKDVNLAGTGADRRMTNNRLQNVSELDSDNEMEVWDAGTRKTAAATKPDPVVANSTVSRTKVGRMRERAKSQIDFEKDVDELASAEKKKQNKQMEAVRFYNKNIRDDTCDDVTGMLMGGDDDWMQGQSQEMHQQVINTRAYKYN